MSGLTVVARIAAKKDSVEEVKNELLKIVEPTRDEQGCIAYVLHQDNDDPALFIIYENWESNDCLDSHMNTPHFKHLVAAIDGRTEELTINKLTRLK